MKEEIQQKISHSGFQPPKKQINTSQDMAVFFKSDAHARISDLISRLSLLVCLKKIPQTSDNKAVDAVVQILEKLNLYIDEVPPDQGPRRFGNIAFRQWHDKLEQLDLDIPTDTATMDCTGVWTELLPYFLGAFGSKQRLDYGTGHELSFLAFIGGLLYTEIIKDPSGEDMLYVFNAYLKLIQRLVLSYTLEPAGSHGVWGLDDHFHLPYILGSAQIVDITQSETPTPEFPPSIILDKRVVEEQAPTNLYFACIKFINEVKRGPFFEHSPILYGTTQVQTWHKVHKGMIKMYHGEVLSKFPVVQHFDFGSFFPWPKDHLGTATAAASS